MRHMIVGLVLFMACARSAEPSMASAPLEAQERKIITTLSLDIAVNDAMLALRELKAKVATEPEAYVAKEESTSASGSRRYAMVSLRVPSKRVDAFADSLASLGEVQRKSRDAEDVTDQYVDNEAHLRSLRAEDERLLALMKSATGKLDDVLAVERELTRVRSELETLQGRQRLLEHQVALSTLAVNLMERHDYLPASAPPFLRSAAETLGDSFAALLAFVRGLALVVVAILPWSPLVALVVWLGLRLVRRKKRLSA